MNIFIECQICNKPFHQPVFLPCGHTICKKHEIDENDQHKRVEKVTCPTCWSEHTVTEQGFPLNIHLDNLIKFSFKDIDLGAEHSVAVKSFTDLKGLVSELKRYRDNPELEINRVFGDLRNKIDLKREKAKKSLDDDALGLIAEIDELEAKCKAGLNESLKISNETNELIKSLEDEIPLWDNDLKSFKRNVKRQKTIHVDTLSKNDRLRQAKEEIKRKLFTDELVKIEQKQKKFCQENSESLL